VNPEVGCGLIGQNKIYEEIYFKLEEPKRKCSQRLFISFHSAGTFLDKSSYFLRKYTPSCDIESSPER
jgi:hypothetical protein